MIQYKFDFEGAKQNKMFSSYSQRQVDSINAIMCQCSNNGLTVPQIAYVLATAYHEAYNPAIANSRITPITEFGSNAYLKGKKYYPYHGRGFVQLTWKENYDKQGKRLGIDLVNNPDLALDLNYASDILVWGMKHGEFTGKRLSDYINNEKKDYINARRIINGVDKKELIASYAEKFEKLILK